MHEVGHHLNKLLYGGKEGKLNTDPLKEFSDELGKLATPGPKKVEGFAEFVRLYLTDPGRAQDAAPRFHKEFEVKMAENLEIREVLVDTRKQIRRYVEQPSSAKVLSHISKEEPPASPPNSFSRVYTLAVDAMTPIKEAVDAMKKKAGAKIKAEDDAYILSRLFAGWVGKADHFLRKGTFDPGTKNLTLTGKSLKDILSPIGDQLDNLRILLTARRVIEKGEQGKETGITLEDAQKSIEEVSNPELEQAAKDIDEYQDQLLQYLSKSGYISQEQYESIREWNKNYVPFYRVMESGPSKKGRIRQNLHGPVEPGKEDEGIDAGDNRPVGVDREEYLHVHQPCREKQGCSGSREPGGQGRRFWQVGRESASQDARPTVTARRDQAGAQASRD